MKLKRKCDKAFRDLLTCATSARPLPVGRCSLRAPVCLALADCAATALFRRRAFTLDVLLGRYAFPLTFSAARRPVLPLIARRSRVPRAFASRTGQTTRTRCPSNVQVPGRGARRSRRAASDRDRALRLSRASQGQARPAAAIGTTLMQQRGRQRRRESVRGQAPAGAAPTPPGTC
jgi:hypothetical protein